ncbi:MAG TPA: hypothetical protein PK095_03585 [Myxococcota bacterium]|nr:hypothetical protein [Myxococcota bacterium]
MDTLTENTNVELTSDGFVAVSVDRTYDDGIGYRAKLHFQRGDVGAVADAFERFVGNRVDETVTLADGALRIFDMPPSPLVNVELDRHEDLVHGGYDTLDLGVESVAGLVASLRAVAG